MKFFSGFCLQNESPLFEEILGAWYDNPYTVAGFSKGAIDALEYAFDSEDRIDRLLLLSPAWFVEQDESFKMRQVTLYRTNPKAYLRAFFKNALYPSEISLSGLMQEEDEKSLERLLFYEWPAHKLSALLERNIVIETYLGLQDRIIEAKKAHDFFKNYTQSFLFKEYGHFLR